MIAAMVVGVIFILAILLALILTGVTQLKQTELIFSTGSMEAVYDGTPLTNHTWHLVAGQVKKGHQLSATVTGERTNVGESHNTIDIQILDEAGADVTGDYRISYKLGTLKVNPRVITVTSEAAEKIHDGMPLQNPKYTITSEYSRALVLDHTANVDIIGKISDVGETPNEVHAVKIYDGSNTDVSRNYQITIKEGTLRVLLNVVDLVVTTESMEAVYDGAALVCPSWALQSGTLKPGHQATASFSGQQINVGQSPNTVALSIVDENGTDVSNEYNITYQFGKLTVTPRIITITSLDAEKVYDGRPLKQNQNRITSEYPYALVPTHSAIVNITGSITQVGETSNTIHSVTIYDKQNADVTSNYQITLKEGTLRVTPNIVELFFRSSSAHKIYDGTPLTSHKWVLASGELKNGHYADISFIGEQISVGESKNFMQVKIHDADGNDVTNEYRITYDYGTLKVDPLVITVISDSAEKVYDGTPLQSLFYTQRGHALAPGHSLEVMISGTITEVGEVPNTVDSVRVLDSFGVDVTSNYQITIKEGILRITAHETDLIFSTASNDMIYDGTPLTDHNWILDLGELKPGHSVQMSFQGSQTNVGESENRAIATIVDKNGNDVTNEYRIFYNFGTLIVNPRPLTITSPDAEKVYDGTPLEDHNYVLSEFPLVSGHTLEANIIGSIVNVGKTFNEVATVTIYDQYGADVSRNYQITIREGTLCVTENDENGGNNQGEPSGSLDSSGPSDIPVLNIKSDHTGHIYLKQSSFGSFLGNSWAEARPYHALLDNTYGYQHLIGAVMQQNGITKGNAEIEFLSGLYMLPYYLTMEDGNYDIQTNDVWYSGSCNSIATFPYYVYSGYGANLNPISGEYAQEEEAYRAFVYEQYLDIDNQTRSYMEKIIAQQHFDVHDPRIISKVAVYIQNSATYNLEYDTSMDQQDNVVIAFLETYKEGVCRHYASAATLLFRALGIPARYTVGFSCETKSGEWITVKTPGHAWTEVYLDGIGWIPVEVTGTSGAGESVGSPDNTLYKVSPVTVRKQYDGTPLYPTPEVKGLESLLKMGYRYEVVISGVQTEIGISKSHIEQLIIYDADGNDVTESFYLKLDSGTLHVYHTELYFQTEPIDKVYDAVPLEPGVLTEGSLIKGHTLSIVSTTPLSAGKHINTYTVSIYDQNGADVTYYYYIRKNFTVATISPLSLIIKAADAQKKYDGTPLTCPHASIIEGSLLQGHRIDTLVVVGSQTAVGRSENVVSKIKIVDADGNDVSENYMIEFQVGKLRVTFS